MKTRVCKLSIFTKFTGEKWFFYALSTRTLSKSVENCRKQSRVSLSPSRDIMSFTAPILTKCAGRCSTPLHDRRHLYQTSPTQATKYGQYGEKLIYALKWSTAVTEPIFVKIALIRQLSVQNCFTEFHESPSNGYMLQTHRRTNVVST